MNANTEQILFKSPNKRFPGKTWSRLKELYEKFQKGEITEEQLDNKCASIADYYDNIKADERWWAEDSLITRPYKINSSNAAEYGLDRQLRRSK